MAVLDVLSKRVPQPPKGVELRAGGGRRRANGVQRGQIEVTCKKVTQIPPNARQPSKKELMVEWDLNGIKKRSLQVSHWYRTLPGAAHPSG